MGWEGGNAPFGEQGGGRANLQLTGLHIGVGRAPASPKCLNLLGRKKQRKTNKVIQCLQKKGIIISRQDSEAPAGGRERNRRNE